jgi:hypothetical protein
MASAPTSGNRYSRSRADAGWAACACDHLASSGLREDVIVTKRAAAMGPALSMPARKDHAASGAFPRGSLGIRGLGLGSFAGP